MSFNTVAPSTGNAAVTGEQKRTYSPSERLYRSEDAVDGVFLAEFCKEYVMEYSGSYRLERDLKHSLRIGSQSGYSYGVHD